MLTRRKTRQPQPFKAGRDQNRVRADGSEARDVDDVSSERSTPRKRKSPTPPLEVKTGQANFHVHDVVWAKMKGSGPWPAKIVKLGEEQVS